VALALVPLLAASASSVTLVRDRLGSTSHAGRITQLAALASEATTVSDHSYFDGYVLSAEVGSGEFVAHFPSVRQMVEADLVQQEGELGQDIANIDAGTWPISSLRPEATRLSSLLAEEKAGRLSTSDLSVQFVEMGSQLYGLAQQTLSEMGSQAIALAGSSTLVAQIQMSTELNVVIGDADSLLVSMFEDITPGSALDRAQVRGEMATHIQQLSDDLVRTTSFSPLPLGPSIEQNVAQMRQLLSTANTWLDQPATQPISLLQIETLGRVADSFAAASVAANVAQTTAIGDTSSAIRRHALQTTELAVAAIGLLVLLTLALTLVIYRGLRRPMKALAIRARQISDGSLELGEESGSREIEEISAALNDAIRNLNQLKAQSEALGTGDLANPVLKQPVAGRLGESLFASVMQATELQRQLGYRATHDPLTGLLNREAANDALEKALEAGRERAIPVAAAFIDLDGFKQMNDNYGHAFGDQVLQVTADRLAVHAGPDDLVSRLGGDEFLLVVRDATDIAAVHELAQRVQAAVQQPISVGPGQVRLGASIGIAFSDPSQKYTASQLLREADVAVYKAKTSGRNQVRIFDESTRLENQASTAMETDLRHALENGLLSLHYQPLVAVMGGEVWGYEALLRWEHRGATMDTGDVIAVAETTDLIIDLDRWVLDRACHQLALLGPHDRIRAVPHLGQRVWPSPRPLPAT
jgi:diguanylate cyclase (GGDEF)-like protein